MKIFSSKKRVAVIGAITAVTLVGGGTAFAYWTTTGSDTGTALVGTNTPFTVTIGGMAGGLLSPNGAIDTFDVTVSNPGPGVQQLRQVDVSVTDTSNPGCTAADFSVNGEPPNTVATIPHTVDLVGVTGSYVFQDVTLQMVDSGDDQEACKNVTVNLLADAS
jgi:hypothetical protein